MQVKDGGESECLLVMSRIRANALSRKTAHFRQVCSYKKYVVRLLFGKANDVFDLIKGKHSAAETMVVKSLQRVL